VTAAPAPDGTPTSPAPSKTAKLPAPVPLGAPGCPAAIELGPIDVGAPGGVVLLAAHVHVTGPAAVGDLGVRWRRAGAGDDPAARDVPTIARLDLRTGAGVSIILAVDPVRPGLTPCYLLDVEPAAGGPGSTLELADGFAAVATAGELGELVKGWAPALKSFAEGRGGT